MKRFSICISSLILYISLVGCIAINKREIFFSFEPTTRRLEILSGNSGLNLVKIESKSNNDTLKLNIFLKPFYLTTKRDNQITIRHILINPEINYISYLDSTYILSSLPKTQ